MFRSLRPRQKESLCSIPAEAHPVRQCAGALLCLLVAAGACLGGIDGQSPLAQSRITVGKKARVYLPFDAQKDGHYPNMVAQFSKHICRIQGKVLSVDGLFGKALRTHGEGCVAVPGVVARGFPYPSFEFWIRVADKFPRTDLLRMTDGNGGVVWRLTLLGSNEGARLQWHMKLKDQTSLTAASSEGLSQPGRWYRLLIFKKDWGIRFYRDGYLVGEEPTRIPLLDAAGPLLIRTPEGGAIDEFALSSDGPDVVHPDLADLRLKPRNLDFEGGDKGWVGLYDEPAIDEKVKHGGKRSLRIETDDAYTREYLSPMFSVEPRATYRVSFWAKVDKFDKGYASVSVWLRWYFAPEETCSFGGDLVAHCLHEGKERTFGWRKFSADIPVWHDKSFFREIRWARLQVKNYHSQVLAWVDDLTVGKMSEQKKDQSDEK